jgi:hypothetical protein
MFYEASRSEPVRDAAGSSMSCVRVSAEAPWLWRGADGGQQMGLSFGLRKLEGVAMTFAGAAGILPPVACNGPVTRNTATTRVRYVARHITTRTGTRLPVDRNDESPTTRARPTARCHGLCRLSSHGVILTALWRRQSPSPLESQRQKVRSGTGLTGIDHPLDETL